MTPAMPPTISPTSFPPTPANGHQQMGYNNQHNQHREQHLPQHRHKITTAPSTVTSPNAVTTTQPTPLQPTIMRTTPPWTPSPSASTSPLPPPTTTINHHHYSATEHCHHYCPQTQPLSPTPSSSQFLI
eukprot:m.86308 g.86308  ORF g.86308 m.86308 type:complete len:129 (-) comp25954_c2_seq1:134-520(-)